MSLTVGSKDHTIKTDEGVEINAELDAQTILLQSIVNNTKIQQEILEELQLSNKLLKKIYNPE